MGHYSFQHITRWGVPLLSILTLVAISVVIFNRFGSIRPANIAPTTTPKQQIPIAIIQTDVEGNQSDQSFITLTALKPQTGSIIWQIPNLPSTDIPPVLTGNEIVAILAPGNVVASFDVHSGNQLWQKQLPLDVTTDSLIQNEGDDDIFYAYTSAVSASQGTLIALNASTGAQLWQTTVSVSSEIPTTVILPAHGILYAELGNQVFAWNSRNGNEIGKITNLPDPLGIQTNGSLLFVHTLSADHTKTHSVIAYSADLKKQIWKHDNVIPSAASQTIVYTSSFYPANKTVALNASTGQTLWESPGVSFETVINALSTDQDGLYGATNLQSPISSTNDTIVALDDKTGVQRWHQSLNGSISSLAAIDHLIIASDQPTNNSPVLAAPVSIDAFAANNGKPLWSIPLGNTIHVALAVGMIDALNSSATPFPTRTPAATPIANACADWAKNGPLGPLPTGIPLPPGTLVGYGNGATGEVLTAACTDNTTKDAINTFMAHNLPLAGWHPYNPAQDGAGCQKADWAKGHEALSWTFGDRLNGTGYGPPMWTLWTCNRLGY